MATKNMAKLSKFGYLLLSCASVSPKSSVTNYLLYSSTNYKLTKHCSKKGIAKPGKEEQFQKYKEKNH